MIDNDKVVSRYGFSDSHMGMFFWNSHHRVWSKIIDVFDDCLVELVITPIGWQEDLRVHIPDIGRIIKTYYAYDNTDIITDRLPNGVIKWLRAVDGLEKLVKEGVIDDSYLDITYNQLDPELASKCDTDDERIVWTYPRVITAIEARNIQHSRGYDSAGYGFYGHTVRDNKVTRWECRNNCD